MTEIKTTNGIFRFKDTEGNNITHLFRKDPETEEIEFTGKDELECTVEYSPPKIECTSVLSVDFEQLKKQDRATNTIKLKAEG
jgi:hypothetical protein